MNETLTLDDGVASQLGLYAADQFIVQHLAAELGELLSGRGRLLVLGHDVWQAH